MKNLCAIHAVFRDGYSGSIENWITLPSKNPIQLYSQFYRPILLKTGVFDQVRVDMGKEWVLILFIQELLSGFRENMDKPAHVKTTSKKNLTIERIWPEVNSRVNYPIKRVLVDLEEKGILDMTNENVQFCVSWFTCGVAKVGMKRFVDAWNNHRIKGKPGNAVPSIRKLQSNTLKPLTEAVVPNEEHAVRMFEAQGGQLQREWRVGRDLLTGDNHARQQRKRFFLERHSFENIFTALVSGNPQPFKNGLKYFMRLTYSM